MIRNSICLLFLQILLCFLIPGQGTGKPACKYDFTVYVYPLSSSLSPLRLAEEARRNQTYHICIKCIFEQFALEYVVYDFFTQFCGRTYNPEEADYFYLPIVRDIDYRTTLPNRNPSPMENVLLQAIEKKNLSLWNSYLNVSDYYWKRNNGADHIIAMPAPVTNLRHQSSMRGFFHYMIQLTEPVFLNVEFSHSFVKEYPVCATEKNIVMPYPSTDPEMLTAQMMYALPPSIESLTSNIEGNRGQSHLRADHVREKLLFYQGGRHGSCEEIRVALAKLMSDRSIASEKGSKKRGEGFQTAKFCPIPIGDSPSSKRMYDVMHAGCVPVVLSDDLVWAYSLDTGGYLNASSFSIQLPQMVVLRTVTELLAEVKEEDMARLPSGISLYSLLQQTDTLEGVNRSDSGSSSSSSSSSNALIHILSRIPRGDLLQLQRGVHVASASYRYYQYNSTQGTATTDIPTSYHRMPDGNAIEVLAQVLSLKKKKGILTVNDACQVERKQPGHKYIGDYPCERGNQKKKRKTQNPLK